MSRIRCVTVIDKPFTFIDHSQYDEHKNKCSYGMKCSHRSKNTCCVGFIIDLFEIVVKETGLNVDM